MAVPVTEHIELEKRYSEQTFFFENVKLLLCGYGLVRVSNSHK